MSYLPNPEIECLYKQDAIFEIIEAIPSLKQKLQSTRQANQGAMVITLINREKGYKAHQFDLYLLIGRQLGTEAAGPYQLLMIKDFIRRKTNIDPAIQLIEQISDIKEEQIFKCIKEQIRFLNSPANGDLCSAGADRLS